MAQSPSTLPGPSREISAVTRRDIFDYLQAEKEPWWGRLDEIGFLGQLYDLGALPSTDSRHTTAAQDILRHRVANLDWDDNWVFGDERFQLADGPDQVLLDFLVRMAHPLVRPDTGQAIQLVTALNNILAPDGWELRTSSFLSGRPIYAAARTACGPGRMIRLDIADDDAGQLDIVLGQVHHLLGENGDTHAENLILGTTLTLRRDGGYFHPHPRRQLDRRHLRGRPDRGPPARAGVHHRGHRPNLGDATRSPHPPRTQGCPVPGDRGGRPAAARHRRWLARRGSPGSSASTRQPGAA